MMSDHWFWLLLTALCVIWYSTITVLVAVRGMKDIRGMLERLSKKSAAREDDNAGP